jgi:hypothetical protein
MRIKITIVFCFVIFAFHIKAQIGGRYAYEFLELPASARTTALGGSVISVIDQDNTLAWSNPALLNEKMRNTISINQNWHFAGINNGYFSYARTIEQLGINAHAAVQYISYGDFVLADEIGENIGAFSGGETAIILGASKNYLDRLTYGANIKFIFSSLESYGSFGMAADLGINYKNESGNMNISAVVKNLGGELSSYTDERYSAPLDIQIGISQRLKYLPFRISIIAHQLQQWSIRYDDPNQETTSNIFGEEETESSFTQGLDNFFRHFIFSGEFLLGKNENLNLRFGYNHLRRKELAVSQFRSLGGFSLGFGISIKGIKIDYGVGYHHLAGAANQLSLSTDLDKFSRKSKLSID